MKIIFFGSSEISACFLEELHKSRHSIKLVVTVADKPAGRGRKIIPNIMKSKASGLGINFIQIDKFDSIFFDKFKRLNIDAAVIVSFGKIFPKKIFGLTSAKWLNAHPSLLPQHRGPAPIISTLLSGDKAGGVSIIEVIPEVDAGDIYAQVKFKIEEDDNRDSLEKKSIIFGSSILIKVLDLIESDGIKPYPQDKKNVSYSCKIKKEDLRIDWNNSAEEIVNRIRAFSSNPGAYCLLKGLRIKILKARVLEGPAINTYLPDLKAYKGRKNGFIIKAGKDAGILVKCNKNEIIRIEILQPQGKKVMPAVDFINGYRPGTGDNFE